MLVSVTGENETDLFLLFNRAKCVNRDTAGNINKVVIVSQPDNNSPDMVLVGLTSGGIFRKLNWNKRCAYFGFSGLWSSKEGS